MVKTGIRVVDDPTGLYKAGAEFRMLDLAYGAWWGVWPEGVVFEITDRSGVTRVARMREGTIVREDGAILKVKGDSVCRWVG